MVDLKRLFRGKDLLGYIDPLANDDADYFEPNVPNHIIPLIPKGTMELTLDERDRTIPGERIKVKLMHPGVWRLKGFFVSDIINQFILWPWRLYLDGRYTSEGNGSAALMPFPFGMTAYYFREEIWMDVNLPKGCNIVAVVSLLSESPVYHGGRIEQYIKVCDVTH